MANPVCLSPLKIYDAVNKQCHRKSYAYNHISPLVVPLHYISPFQFVISDIDSDLSVDEIYIRDIDDRRITGNVLQDLQDAGFTYVTVHTYKIAIFNGLSQVEIPALNIEGLYYLEFVCSNGDELFSEVCCGISNLDDYLQIEYWNQGNNPFYIKNGAIAFPNLFHFKIYLKTEIGKPEYKFEEEGTKRLGYTFIETQVSKKIYKFNVVIPEFLCDAMRIIRLCSNKIISSHGDELDAISFEIEAEWQTQGDLASVTCEFETDNVIANLGGYVSPLIGGDYDGNDYNRDFNTNE